MRHSQKAPVVWVEWAWCAQARRREVRDKDGEADRGLVPEALVLSVMSWDLPQSALGY